MYNQILASVLLVNIKLMYSTKQHISYMYFKLKIMQIQNTISLHVKAFQMVCLSDLYFTWFGDLQVLT